LKRDNDGTDKKFPRSFGDSKIIRFAKKIRRFREPLHWLECHLIPIHRFLPAS